MQKILSFLFAGVLLLTSCVSPRYPKGDLRRTKMEQAFNYRAGKFHNTVAWKRPSFWKFFPVLWEFMFKRNNRVPRRALPAGEFKWSDLDPRYKQEIRIIWLGHSSILLNMEGKIILLDPIFVNRYLPLGPRRYNASIPFQLLKFIPIDWLLISHNHLDHLNKFSIKYLRNSIKKCFVPLGVGACLEKWGIPRERIIELSWWEERIPEEGFKIAATPAQHSSGRSLGDMNETLWASWVICSPRYRVFFSGDSGYSRDFRKIGERFGPFDITFMECGTYDQRWHHIHLFPGEAVDAHRDLKGKILFPIHWGTFRLALNPWYEPIVRLTGKADKLGVRVVAPKVGETVIYPGGIPTERWWEVYIKN